MDVVVSHANTDFDALGAMVAARRLYPGAVLAVSGSLNRNVREFARLHAEELDLRPADLVELDLIHRLIVVETSRPERLGEFERVARDPSVEVVVFDHHPVSIDWRAVTEVVLSQDAALTTTMAGILAERELDLSPFEATVLALGIHEDTGSLGFRTTTVRDVEALAWCLRHGARQEIVAQYLHTPLSEPERALLEALLASAASERVHGVDILIAAVSWPDYVEGVSNLAHKVADLTDCRTLVVLVEMEGRVFCVVRARTGELDSVSAAAALGGGGHAGAASAVFRGSLAQAKRAVRAVLPQAVRPGPSAGEIMSAPPHFVLPDDSVAHAMVLCQRHRQSGVQVGEPRRLLGIVTREDLDRAIGHGLSHAPVKSVMSSHVETCERSMPLGELRRLLAASEAGRLPVVADGEVVGVVTRSDLLRALEGREAEKEPPTTIDLSGQLLALEDRRSVLEAIQATGSRFAGVYLVGGAVRDLLIGERSVDLDLAVEGDGIEFAGALAKTLHGRLVAHRKFGTAVVLYGQSGRIDVASARSEFYDRPAALPTVERAGIRHDLYRRDFTINAMAVSLGGDDFGRLVDFFGGLRDLESRTIRVLHNLSFIDDPTRLFRAVRYENRYGFRMDAHTLSLARACVEMGLVGELSSARLRDELQTVLGEESVCHATVRLAELDLDKAIHPQLLGGEEAAALIGELDSLAGELVPEAPRWRLRLAVLARRMSAAAIYEWADRLRLRRRDADRLADAVAVALRLPALLEPSLDPAQIRRLVAPHDPDGAILALLSAPAGSAGNDALRRYFEQLRQVELEIGGTDLELLELHQSPAVGEILGEVLRQKLNGAVAGREEELALARALLAEKAAHE